MPFDSFQPGPELLARLVLASKAAKVTAGSRVWCHALALDDGEVGHCFLADGSATDETFLDAFVVVLRMGGSCTPVLGDAAPMSFSEVFVYPRGEIPAIRYRGGTHEFSMLLPGPHAEGGLPMPLTVPLVEPVWRLILTLRSKADPARCRADFDRVIRRAKCHVARELPRSVQAAARYIEAHWQSGVRTAEAAHVASVSTAHLCRSFLSAFGMSISEYIRLLQLNRAAGLLWGTTMPIGEVANVSGFYDQSHLCRELARRVGATPSSFRSLAPCLGNVRLKQVRPLIDPETARVVPRHRG